MANETNQKVDNRPIIVQWLERDKATRTDKSETAPTNPLKLVLQKHGITNHNR